MALHKPLRIVVFAVVLSAIAPGTLLGAGVTERDLLLVVFLPSVAVGLASAWFAARRPSRPTRWAIDDRRMP